MLQNGKHSPKTRSSDCPKDPILYPSSFGHHETAPVEIAMGSSVKRSIRSSSILKDGRAVFNIAGNKYRIVVWINYAYRVVYIRFIGTHRQYDAIDAETV